MLSLIPPGPIQTIPSSSNRAAAGLHLNDDKSCMRIKCETCDVNLNRFQLHDGSGKVVAEFESKKKGGCGKVKKQRKTQKAFAAAPTPAIP
jgi:hypothetical protein